MIDPDIQLAMRISPSWQSALIAQEWIAHARQLLDIGNPYQCRSWLHRAAQQLHIGIQSKRCTPREAEMIFRTNEDLRRMLERLA